MNGIIIKEKQQGIPMKKSLIVSNILIWVMVLLAGVGSSLFEGMDTVRAEVEYDYNMTTDCF